MAVNTAQLRIVLPLDAFPQELDEIVLLSSMVGLQQADQTTALDFYSVSGFQTSSTFKCKLIFVFCSSLSQRCCFMIWRAIKPAQDFDGFLDNDWLFLDLVVLRLINELSVDEG